MAFARIIVFALALTHAVGLADLVLADDCEETCSDDGCTDCMPGVACRCHGPSAMAALAPIVAEKRDVFAPVARGSVAQHAHSSPDPREILHVPKRVV